MRPILDVIKRALVPAGIVLALTSGVARADVLPPAFKPFMNQKSISNLPWRDQQPGAPVLSAMRPVEERGSRVNPFSRDSYLAVLIGPDFGEFARRNPYVVYASVLFLPDAWRSRAGRALLLVAGTPMQPIPPAPVPLPAPLVLLLSGLGVVLGFRARSRTQPPAVTATA